MNDSSNQFEGDDVFQIASVPQFQQLGSDGTVQFEDARFEDFFRRPANPQTMKEEVHQMEAQFVKLNLQNDEDAELPDDAVVPDPTPAVVPQENLPPPADPTHDDDVDLIATIPTLAMFGNQKKYVRRSQLDYAQRKEEEAQQRAAEEAAAAAHDDAPRVPSRGRYVVTRSEAPVLRPRNDRSASTGPLRGRTMSSNSNSEKTDGTMSSRSGSQIRAPSVPRRAGSAVPVRGPPSRGQSMERTDPASSSARRPASRQGSVDRQVRAPSVPRPLLRGSSVERTNPGDSATRRGPGSRQGSVERGSGPRAPSVPRAPSPSVVRAPMRAQSVERGVNQQSAPRIPSRAASVERAGSRVREPSVPRAPVAQEGEKAKVVNPARPRTSAAAPNSKPSGIAARRPSHQMQPKVDGEKEATKEKLPNAPIARPGSATVERRGRDPIRRPVGGPMKAPASQTTTATRPTMVPTRNAVAPKGATPATQGSSFRKQSVPVTRIPTVERPAQPRTSVIATGTPKRPGFNTNLRAYPTPSGMTPMRPLTLTVRETPHAVQDRIQARVAATSAAAPGGARKDAVVAAGATAHGRGPTPVRLSHTKVSDVVNRLYQPRRVGVTPVRDQQPKSPAPAGPTASIARRAFGSAKTSASNPIPLRTRTRASTAAAAAVAAPTDVVVADGNNKDGEHDEEVAVVEDAPIVEPVQVVDNNVAVDMVQID